MRRFVKVGKHALAETISRLSLGNRHDNNRRIVEAVFSIGSARRLYNEDISRVASLLWGHGVSAGT
jgi:hypothetical protein